MIQNRRILLFGADGQVGHELQRSFSDAGDLIALNRRHADLNNPEQLREVVRNAAPDVILNAAAYTAVDGAEDDPASAFSINSHAVRVLAEEASRRSILLIHYSTDYIFDGSKSSPWLETDQPNPLNVYGASKLAGERAVADLGGKYLIFRTSWVYGPRGKNFLLTMLRLASERDRLTIVDDQTGAPTSSIAIAGATRAVVESISSGAYGADYDWSGIYHMTCSGSTSWYGFANGIFRRAGSLVAKRPEVVPVPSKDYPMRAKRPLNSVLSNEKLASRLGVSLSSWDAALESVLSRLRG